MKKWDFVKKVAAKAGVTKIVADAVLEAMCEEVVVETLDNGGDVNLPSIGKFYRKETKAHMGRNPQTGEQIPVPESHNLAFRASSALKRKIEAKPAKKVIKKK